MLWKVAIWSGPPPPRRGGTSGPSATSTKRKNGTDMGKVIRCEECGRAYRTLDDIEDLRDNDGICMSCNAVIEVSDWDRILASYEDEDLDDVDDEDEDEEEEEDEEDEEEDLEDLDEDVEEDVEEEGDEEEDDDEEDEDEEEEEDD